MALTTGGQFSYRKAHTMRTRKAVITIALAAAALGAPVAAAAPALAAPAPLVVTTTGASARPERP
jgi:uncharacterized membrane protein